MIVPELRKEMIKTQFENIMKTIEKRSTPIRTTSLPEPGSLYVEWRSTDNKDCIIVGTGSFYPEVAEMISKEGYDVHVVRILCGSRSFFKLHLNGKSR